MGYHRSQLMVENRLGAKVAGLGMRLEMQSKVDWEGPIFLWEMRVRCGAVEPMMSEVSSSSAELWGWSGVRN